MKDERDDQTMDLLPSGKRRGRPPTGKALSPAAKQGGLMPNGTKTYVSGGTVSKKSFWRRRYSMKCSNRFNRHAMSSFFCVSNLLN